LECGRGWTEHVVPIRATADDEQCRPSGNEPKDVHGGLPVNDRLLPLRGTCTGAATLAHIGERARRGPTML
jgi:hypothetical protein